VPIQLQPLPWWSGTTPGQLKRAMCRAGWLNEGPIDGLDIRGMNQLVVMEMNRTDV
jgi:hypothetical protein